MERVFGGSPFSSSRSPSAPTATMVPIVSKKSASMTLKESTTTATIPSLWKEPRGETCPSVAKSGAVTGLPLRAGVVRPHPPEGLALTLKRASTMSAHAVEKTIPMRIAPLTRRTMSTAVRARPATKTRSGQVDREPLTAKTRGGESTRSGLLCTIPAFTSPTKVTNRPMPTEMAVRR